MMLGAAQLVTGTVAVLLSTSYAAAKEAPPPHHALPSYHYGAPIRVECMNRNLYARIAYTFTFPNHPPLPNR